MAALVVSATFDLATLREEVSARLPEYARPLFLRILPELELTSTFKPKKRELVIEGFDPTAVSDPLYFDDRARGAYVRLDAALFQRLQIGVLRL